jgi:hypothetical protein
VVRGALCAVSIYNMTTPCTCAPDVKTSPLGARGDGESGMHGWNIYSIAAAAHNDSKLRYWCSVENIAYKLSLQKRTLSALQAAPRGKLFLHSNNMCTECTESRDDSDGISMFIIGLAHKERIMVC